MGERRGRLFTRLWRAFVLQVVLISATASAGVYLAEFAIREMLIVSALRQEADYFWARRRIAADTPAPNTNALIGYVFERDSRELPAEFAGLNLGIHELTTPVGQVVAHVSESDGHRLYLLFDANNVARLATYFGIAPLAFMLIVLYTSAWVAYRVARRAVSPVVRLARVLHDLDVETPDLAAIDAAADGGDSEVERLAAALRQLVTRVDRFVERERAFTREASHELRSPLTVVRMASDTLLKRPALDTATRALVEKIRRAALDMEELTEVLLMLAREHEGLLVHEAVEVNEVVEQELTRCRMIYGDKDLTLRFTAEVRLEVDCSARILAVVFGNLLRNACAYTDRGSVDVAIEPGGVRISDSGIGIPSEHLGRMFTPYFRGAGRGSGQGLGLSLVKRICDRFGWEVRLDSEPGRGTEVQVRFANATVRALPSGAPVTREASPPAA